MSFRIGPATILVLLASIPGCTGGLAVVERSYYPAPKTDHLVFWGHACVYIESGGTGVVTDPVFDRGLWQRRRFIGRPPDDAIARVRVVLLSHAHDDHTSPATLARFAKDVIVLCPAPTAGFLAEKGIEAKAMRAGETHEVDGIRFVAIAMHHPGARHAGDPAIDGRALGWIIITTSATVFYSGDSDYCSSFSDVGWTYSPDIAVLNVNGHLKPADTARAARDTRARVVIPTHWGAYGYWVVGGNRRPRGNAELQELIGKPLHVLDVGAWVPMTRSELP